MTTDSETRSLLKSYFQYGDTPTEAQFAELIDKLATVVELQAEEDARIAADTAETNARIAADNALDARIVSNDAELADIHTLLGTSANDTNLGSFSGSILGSTPTVKAALQAIETYIQTTRDNLNAEIASTNSDITTLTNNLNSEINQTDADIAALRSDLTADLNAEIASTDSDIASLRSDLNGEIATTNSEISALQSDLSSEIATTNSEVNNLTADLNAEIAATDEEIEAHGTRISNLETSVLLDSFIFACSSETGDIGTGVKSTFRMPYGFSCTEVRASLVANTASSPVELKVLVNGTAITDQIDIAAGFTTTYQSGTPSTFLLGQNSSPVSITMDSEVSVNVLTAPIGASGLKVTLVGYVGNCSIAVQEGNITFPITFPLGTVTTSISCLPAASLPASNNSGSTGSSGSSGSTCGSSSSSTCGSSSSTC